MYAVALGKHSHHIMIKSDSNARWLHIPSLTEKPSDTGRLITVDKVTDTCE